MTDDAVRQPKRAERPAPLRTAESVLKWLREEGYPLELRVGELLRNARWLVEHAHWYEDPSTGKARELDLVARRGTSTADHSSVLTFSLAVECKTSSSAWVVFTSPLNLGAALRIGRAVDEFSNDALAVARKYKIPAPRVFGLAGNMGHGIAKAHSGHSKGDPTGPYAALLGAATAARQLGKESERWWQTEPGNYQAHVVAPVVVLDGPLFEYSISDGEEQLREVQSSRVVLAMPGLLEGFVVSLVTISQLETWVADVTEEVDRFCEAMLPHAFEVIRRVNERQTRHVGDVLDLRDVADREPHA